MRRRSKALCVPGTGVPCRPGAPGFASACSSTIGEHGRVSVAPARTRIPGAFPICVHRCNLWIGPSQFPSFSVSRCLCPPRQDRRPCQGGCLSPHFPAKLRHSPPILPPFLSFASFVVNTSLVTARHAKILPPSSPSAGEPPAATGSVACASGSDPLGDLSCHGCQSSWQPSEHCQPCACAPPLRNRSPTPPPQGCQPGGAHAGNVGNLRVASQKRIWLKTES